MLQLEAALRWILSVLFVLCVSACSERESDIGLTEAEAEPVVARIGERKITAAELDASLKLELHDLAMAAYELRLGRLLEMVRHRGDKQQSDYAIFLPLPEPPRINLPENTRPPRGNPEAPITVAVFCSYQSPHCKSIQPILRRLTSKYAGWVKEVLYDLPLKYHRQGVSAANAVRCAEAQGALWSFQDGLYAYFQSLSDEVYRRLVEQMGLNFGAFQRCIEEKRHWDQIRADMAFAAEIGLKKVPVVFINGLYIKGLQPYDRYAFWVESELRKMGVAEGQRHPWAAQQSTDDIPFTDLPLQLVGISLSDRAENSRAFIEVSGKAAREFSRGGEILSGVRLSAIHSNYIVLDNRGKMEKLPLRGKQGEAVPLTLTRVRDEETLRRIEQPLGEGSRRLIEPSAVLPLGQKWLEEQLQNREELEKKFVEAELEVEGYHLLRLEGIADNEFFTALGFQEKDVLLRVNDTWVHSGRNNLWDALVSGEVVDVVFMRNGLPQRLQYVVEKQGYFEQKEAEDSGGEAGDQAN